MIVRFTTSPAELIYWSIALAFLAAFVATLVVAQGDARTIDGYTSVWAKPLKFELSLALHAATLGLALNLLSPPHRHGLVMLLVAVAFLAACLFEIGYIIIQAARSQQSHFNVGTPFHRLMYSGMAFAAVIIIGAAGAIGIACVVDAAAAGSPALRFAILLGFVGGMVLTLITAFTIGGRMSPYVGGVPDFGARMVFTGWSQSSGDLRVSHFLATHMIQIVPFVGLLVERIATGRTAVVLVAGFAMLWTLATLHEYRTALAGKPSIVTTSSW